MAIKSWLIMAVGAIMLVAGLAIAGTRMSPAGVAVEEVHFNGASGASMRALLFRPDTATAQTPAPAILAIHGYLNSAEMQSNFAIEYARRGYVVLAPDMRGHGASAPASFADGFGAPDALLHLRSLPFVDRDNIGLEGHSMGGWAVLSAARAHPDSYRAMVLEGSSVGAPFAPEGDAAFPRNLMVVYSRFDEFGGFMWGPQSPAQTGATEKAMRLFNTEAPVVADRVYGSIEAGTARTLRTPSMTHAWLHHSPSAIGYSIDWFSRTLDGARAIAPENQTWQLKEAASLVALLGVGPFLIGLFSLLSGRAQISAEVQQRRPASNSVAVALSLGVLFLAPIVSYVPLMQLAESFGQNAVFRQTFSNQIAFWLVCNALLIVAMGYLPGMAKPGPMRAQNWRALIAAVLSVGALYGVIATADKLAHVSPQAWFMIWRPLTLSRLQDFLVYLPAFAFYFVVAFRALDAVRPMAGPNPWRTFAFVSLMLAGPFVLFLAAQYGALLITHNLLTPTEGLRVIISILFAPLLLLAGGLAVATTRTSDAIVPGSLMCALLVTWFLTATQPIGFG